MAHTKSLVLLQAPGWYPGPLWLSAKPGLVPGHTAPWDKLAPLLSSRVALTDTLLTRATSRGPLVWD